MSGLPPHVLDLKYGMPVMLLRSMKPPELMNGTRCIIHNCNRHFVEVVIAAGIYSGQYHSIPRIPLRPSDTMFPFQFERKQFPLRPCFAMTINKAQGQTLKVIGLDLRQPIFAHGTLYVACLEQERKIPSPFLHLKDWLEMWSIQKFYKVSKVHLLRAKVFFFVTISLQMTNYSSHTYSSFEMVINSLLYCNN